MNVPREPILKTQKWRQNFFPRTLCGIIGATCLYPTAFGSVTPLLQPDYFKSHGYGPDLFVYMFQTVI